MQSFNLLVPKMWKKWQDYLLQMPFAQLQQSCTWWRWRFFFFLILTGVLLIILIFLFFIITSLKSEKPKLRLNCDTISLGLQQKGLENSLEKQLTCKCRKGKKNANKLQLCYFDSKLTKTQMIYSHTPNLTCHELYNILF